jgi:hypothetical protein
MKLRQFLLLTTAMLLTAATTAQAQFGPPARGSGGGKPPGVSAAMAKVFGKNNAFISTADLRMLDASGKEMMSVPAKYSYLEGSSYFHIDLTEIKGAQFPPQAMATMKQFGMNELATATKAGAKTVFQIYPGLKAYVEQPVSAQDAAVDKAEVKSEQVGEETVNGHKCKKHKITVTADGKTQEVLTWNATEMKDFPVKIETKEDGNTIIMESKEVKFEKPDAKLFEVPAGFTRYDNPQVMFQTEMMKRMGAPQAPK